MGITYTGGYAIPRLDLGMAYQEFEPEPGLFIAEDVFVPFGTPRRDAKLSVRKRESMLQLTETRRASKGTFNRIDSDLKDIEYACDTHGLEGLVDDEERALYASDFDAEMATVLDVDMALRLAKEVRTANVLFGAQWTGGGAARYTDVSAAQPITNPASDQIGVILDASEKVRTGTGGMMANALVLSYGNLLQLLQNTGIKAMFPGANQVTLGMLEQILPAIFGLQKIIVGRAMYCTSAEAAATPTFASVWSDDYMAVCRVAPSPSAPLRAPSVGRTMKWSLLDAELAVQTYREEQTMSQVIRAFECVDEWTSDVPMSHLVKVRA